MKPRLVQLPTFVFATAPTINISQVTQRRFSIIDRGLKLCEHGIVQSKCQEPECVVREIMES